MFTGNQSRAELRQWLAPPNPSINHNTAHDTQHDGTANWFIQGRTFDGWKANGSLLWIRGNRMLLLPCHTFMTANCLSGFSAGSGKSILWFVLHNHPGDTKLMLLSSTAIIEEIKHIRESRSALVAY